jgi:hypothetical protein
MNEAGDKIDSAWWATHERGKLPGKWSALVERQTGTKPAGSPALHAVRRLNKDRNLVAHFRGVPWHGGGLAVSAPPVKRRGGISAVRAYFDADRAAAAVRDAHEAINALSATGAL